MAANDHLKVFGNIGRIGLLTIVLFSGCDAGDRPVRRGGMRYSATEVFGESTPALALAKAAGRGDVKAVDRLIAGGAQVNALGRHGITPLWWAAYMENFEGFAALLQNGANPNAQRSEGYPIMYLVASGKDARLLQAALKHGGDPNLRDSQSGETPLFPAVLHGLERHIDLLFTAGADVNAQQPVSGQTLPMIAIGSRGDYLLVYRLFQMGADPTLKTKNGQTLADVIELHSINASNNNDPWRKRVLDFLRSKGVHVKNRGKIQP
jgi:ankyrin repeat protein